MMIILYQTWERLKKTSKYIISLLKNYTGHNTSQTDENSNLIKEQMYTIVDPKIPKSSLEKIKSNEKL